MPATDFQGPSPCSTRKVCQGMAWEGPDPSSHQNTIYFLLRGTRTVPRMPPPCSIPLTALCLVMEVLLWKKLDKPLGSTAIKQAAIRWQEGLGTLAMQGPSIPGPSTARNDSSRTTIVLWQAASRNCATKQDPGKSLHLVLAKQTATKIRQI